MLLVVWSYLKVACVSETGKKGVHLYFTYTALPSASANQRERSGYDAYSMGWMKTLPSCRKRLQKTKHWSDKI